MDKPRTLKSCVFQAAKIGNTEIYVISFLIVLRSTHWKVLLDNLQLMILVLVNVPSGIWRKRWKLWKVRRHRPLSSVAPIKNGEKQHPQHCQHNQPGNNPKNQGNPFVSERHLLALFVTSTPGNGVAVNHSWELWFGLGVGGGICCWRGGRVEDDATYAKAGEFGWCDICRRASLLCCCWHGWIFVQLGGKGDIDLLSTVHRWM